MPLYDFKCHACGHEFELLVMGNDKPQCPACKSPELDKLMSGFSVRGGAKESGAASGSGSGCSSCAGGSCSSCH